MIDYVNMRDDFFDVSSDLKELRAVAPHYHDDYVVLILVVKGTLPLNTGRIHRELKKGELAFINKGEIHYTEDTRGNEVLVVHIKDSENYYINSKVFGEGELDDLKEKILALTYFYYMDELIEETDYKKTCDAIISLVDKYFAVSEVPLITYLSSNFRRTVTVKMAAEQTGITERNVSLRLQKEGFGGFRNTLTDVRCRAADKLILETDMQMKRIAAMTGFSSVRSFIRDYGLYAGRTPLQQRKFYREISKHKFNRTKELASHYRLEIIRRYIGELHIKKCLYI